LQRCGPPARGILNSPGTARPVWVRIGEHFRAATFIFIRPSSFVLRPPSGHDTCLDCTCPVPMLSIANSPDLRSHLYAMYSLIQRDIHARQTNSSPGSTSSNDELRVPSVFTDPGYNLLGTSVLSTSNCGNPALRLFGFGPVTPEGYGIGGSPRPHSVFGFSGLVSPSLSPRLGSPTARESPDSADEYFAGYIIKEEGISICMSSKHLQTRRLLATLQAYLYEIRGMLIALWREANERPEAFVDHAGVLRDARTGKAIEEAADEKEDEEMCEWCCSLHAHSSAWPCGWCGWSARKRRC
jgi:hypothetical protein